MQYPDALWLNPSCALKTFHAPLVAYLRKSSTLAQWDYFQTVDEPSCLEIALSLLHDYLKSCHYPIHLIGHSTGGLLGWLYTQRYPKRVRSLTLLSVGGFPAIDWQAHYYLFRQLFPIKREQLLVHMIDLLFGDQPCHRVKQLLQILDQDLTESLSPHTLLKIIPLTGCQQSPVPLLACGGEEDLIVDPNQIHLWIPHLKPEDQVWLCPKGRHFFHTAFPSVVADRVLDFWAEVSEHSLFCRERTRG